MGETDPAPEGEVYLNGAVTLVRRSDGFMAHITGDERLWDIGRTRDEAIGALARTHPKEFAQAIESYREHETRHAVDLTDPANLEKLRQFLSGDITAEEAGEGFGYGREGRPKITVSRKFFEALGGSAVGPTQEDQETERTGRLLLSAYDLTDEDVERIWNNLPEVEFAQESSRRILESVIEQLGLKPPTES